MARLRVDFKDAKLRLGGYEGFDTTNLLGALPVSSGSFQKPVVVYLTGGEESVSKVIDETVLAVEKVALGLKMFDTFKVEGSTIDENHPFADVLGGRQLPRMVVLSPDGERIGAQEASEISASKLYTLMKRATKSAYKTNIDKYTKEYVKLLAVIDKIEGKKETLATRIANSADEHKAKQRKLDKEAEKLAKEEEEMLEREQELLAFVPRNNSKFAKG